MQQGSQDQQNAERRVLVVLNNFLSRHRKTIGIVLIVCAVAVVALFVGLSIRNNRIENSYLAVEDLQGTFAEWLSLEQDEQADAYADLAEAVGQVIDTYGKLYAGARALLIDAEALHLLERYEECEARYVEVAMRFSDTYLAPLAWMGAAIAAENRGDSESAVAHLLVVADDYGDTSPDAAHALFSIGRIYETEDNIIDAAHYYNMLIEDYPVSTWTDLARTRIITLTAQGRIGGS